MKTNTLVHKFLLVAIASAGLSVLGSGTGRADWHDHDNYYDHGHNRHEVITYHKHHGYWNRQNGANIFINID